MKKKVLSFILSGMLLFSSINVYCQEYTPVNLVMEGTAITSDQPAVIYNSRTVVPIRAIAEAFDCNVDWKNETKTVVIGDNGVYIYLTVGSNVITAEMDGESASTEIDTPPVIINNRTMVPIAFISEILGYNVDWDSNTKTVNIYSGETDNTSETEYSEIYLKALVKYAEIDTAVNGAILNITDDEALLEYLEKYDNINSKYTDFIANKDISTYTADDVEFIENLTAEIMVLANELGLDLDNSSTTVNDTDKESEIVAEPVYYINTLPYNTSGGYSIILDNHYDITADYTMDDADIKYICDAYNDFSKKLEQYRNTMNEDLKVMLDDMLINRGNEMLKNINDNSEDASTNAAFLNGINAELCAMAEALNIDIGEDMKEYNVTVNNPVYSSKNMEEITAAYNEANSKYTEYYDTFEPLLISLTDQQQHEYMRIIQPANLYYGIAHGYLKTIDDYRGKLILLERCNKRIEIFADKYNIDL